MSETKKNKWLIISCIIVFIITLLLRLHFISQKQGIHGDEVFSINISNRNTYGWMLYYPENRFYTGKELKNLSLFNDTSLKDTLSDIKQMHVKVNDPPHTNLYYSALRLWCNGFESTNLHKILWRGLSLNLVFFSFSFLILFKILRKLFKNSSLIPFGLLCAFANTGSISETIFMRPYQLQETIFLLLTYCVINFWFDIEQKKLISIKNFIIASFSLAFALLSGYFAPMYIGLLGIVLIVKSIKENQYKNIIFLFFSLITSVALAYTFYNGYFIGFTSTRAQHVFYRISGTEHMGNFKETLKAITNCFIYFIYYIPCIIIAGFIQIKRFTNKTKPHFHLITGYLVACAFLWSIIILAISPYRVVRYITPVFPILALVYPMLLSGFKETLQKNFIAIFSMFILIFALFPQPIESYDTEYPKVAKLFPYSARIENLFISQKLIYTFPQDPNVPVFITARNSIDILSLVPIMNDNQLYFINYEIVVLPTYLKELYLLIDKSAYIDEKILNKSFNISNQPPTTKNLRTIKLIHK